MNAVGLVLRHADLHVQLAEVERLTTFQVLLQVGQLELDLRVAYLMRQHYARLVFSPSHLKRRLVASVIDLQPRVNVANEVARLAGDVEASVGVGADLVHVVVDVACNAIRQKSSLLSFNQEKSLKEQARRRNHFLAKNILRQRQMGLFYLRNECI